MQSYWLALGILSVWRVTHLLNAEDGPWDFVVRLRRRSGTGFWASLLDCFYCLSLWIAAPLAYFIGSRWFERLLLWLALSAGAILLERVVPERPVVSPFYSEDQEDTNVLRQEPTATAGDGRHKHDDPEREPSGSARQQDDAGSTRSRDGVGGHTSSGESLRNNASSPVKRA
jgi:hypothetical protein